MKNLVSLSFVALLLMVGILTACHREDVQPKKEQMSTASPSSAARYIVLKIFPNWKPFDDEDRNVRVAYALDNDNPNNPLLQVNVDVIKETTLFRHNCTIRTLRVEYLDDNGNIQVVQNNNPRPSRTPIFLYYNSPVAQKNKIKKIQVTLEIKNASDTKTFFKTFTYDN